MRQQTLLGNRFWLPQGYQDDARRQRQARYRRDGGGCGRDNYRARASAVPPYTQNRRCSDLVLTAITPATQRLPTACHTQVIGPRWRKRANRQPGLTAEGSPGEHR